MNSHQESTLTRKQSNKSAAGRVRARKTVVSNCCPSKAPQDTKEALHPDHSSNLVRLRRAQGQLAGIEKMIQDRRYCVDILIQFKAASSALKAIEATILEKHLRSCVQLAMESRSKTTVETKIEELMKLFGNT